MLATIIRACAMAVCCAAAAAPNDRDGDGILDEYELILGSDPNSADQFQTVLTAPEASAAGKKSKTYDGGKDFLAVEFAHAGGDRYLWRVTFADTPRPEDTVLHLYLDADAHPETGRKSTAHSPVQGTDYMVSFVGGHGNCNQFDADGKSKPGPQVRGVVHGKTILLSADLRLARDEKGIRYGLYVLCHKSTKRDEPGGMSKSSPKTLVEGLPVSPRAKIVRPEDQERNDRVSATFGLPQLHAILRGPGTIEIPHDKLELDGFAIDLETSARFPHVKLTHSNGRVSTRAPKAGSYHVGFLMYDSSSDERVAISVDGKLRGVAVSRDDNNRTWMYWLSAAIELRGGELVELRACGPNGKHPIVDILFLPKAPEERRVEYRVENMTSAVPVGRPGQVILSWTTTWPCPTRFEYGPTSQYGTKIENPTPSLVHRVILTSLDPKVQYHGRAVGANRDNEPFVGADYEFTCTRPAPPPTRGELTSLPLTVRNEHPFAAKSWPVTSGVPVPCGWLASPDQVRLTQQNREVPAEIADTARWPDGSVKWLLVTFLADVPAQSAAEYRLEFGRDVKRKSPGPAVRVEQASGQTRLEAGAIALHIDRAGRIADVQCRGQAALRSQTGIATEAVDATGNVLRTVGDATVEIEQRGPLRAVLKIVQTLADPKRHTQVRIEQRLSAWRDVPVVQVDHTLLVEGESQFTDLKSVTYRLPLAGDAPAWDVLSAADKPLVLDAKQPRVWQRSDQEYVIPGRGDCPDFRGEAGENGTVPLVRPIRGRLSGIVVPRGAAGPGLAIRDFWQNYPKGLQSDGQDLCVELCPAFDAGWYDRFPFEREGHHLYYYLSDGKYRLKQGTSKTHTLTLCWGDGRQVGQQCTLAANPLLATAPAEWYCRSRAFYDVAPRNTDRFELYEEAVDKSLKSYVATRERIRDFGMLNYGDWYPERRANWGNIEYDTQHAFFLEYIRSGNPAAFFLGHAAELHNRDVDTVHFNPDPLKVGLAYTHQMGHVGGYFDKPVPGTLGITSTGGSVSHAWSEGHFDHYFLTGDRRSWETGIAVTDYFTRSELGRPYDFLSCRTPGWHLIMLAATYAATGDPYYLNAARVVVDRVLEAQDRIPRPLPDYQAAGRKPYQVGGWSRMLVPGHCTCEPRHRGNAGFMVAVLLSGLKYYHDVTADPRVKESIIAGAHNLIEETYSDQTKGFRYTSCPNTRYVAGASPLMVEGIARAYLWTRDERFRRVLMESLPLGARGAPYGKEFSMYYRMAPRVIADMDAAGLTMKREPAK